VSYDHKHNEANGEGNKDGTDDNRSWNCGAEGPTDDPEIVALRARQARNFLATLALSLGVPMFLGGDELGRTQNGNNNAYCQDNEISWYDWENVDVDLLAWTRAVINLRGKHPVFRRRRFFQGRPLRKLATEPAQADIGWFRPDGRLMTDSDWGVGYAKSLGVLLNGSSLSVPDRHGRQVADSSFYLAFNAWDQPLQFRLPGPKWGGPWRIVVDSSNSKPAQTWSLVQAGKLVQLQGHHFVMLECTSRA